MTGVSLDGSVGLPLPTPLGPAERLVGKDLAEVLARAPPVSEHVARNVLQAPGSGISAEGWGDTPSPDLRSATAFPPSQPRQRLLGQEPVGAPPAQAPGGGRHKGSR